MRSWCLGYSDELTIVVKVVVAIEAVVVIVAQIEQTRQSV